MRSETSIFPLIKRFGDVKSSPRTVILKEERTIHEKSFRAGTIFFVSGWREVNGKAYIILNKGSWEGLVSHEDFSSDLAPLFSQN